MNINDLALRIIATYDDLGIELQLDSNNPDIETLTESIINDAMNADDDPIADDLNLLDADEIESLRHELDDQLSLRIYA